MVNKPNNGETNAHFAPDQIIYARDIDATGSAHPCSMGDEGAYAYVREDLLPEGLLQEIKDNYGFY